MELSIEECAAGAQDAYNQYSFKIWLEPESGKGATQVLVEIEGSRESLDSLEIEKTFQWGK